MLCLKNRLWFYNHIRLFTLCSLFVLWACNKEPQKEVSEDLSLYDVYKTDSMRTRVENLIKNTTPIMGHRFVVYGDFDGDSKVDTLRERYTDSLGQKEMPKYYANLNYDDITDIEYYYYRQSFIEHTQHTIDSLYGAPLYMENCGDLNFDGRDELFVLFDLGDMSSISTARIYTFTNHKWQELYGIPIWEWTFPDRYEAISITVPSKSGNFEEYVPVDNDSLKTALDKEIQNFRFFKHFEDNTVEFTYRSDLHSNYDNVTRNDIKLILNRDFKKVKLQDSTYFQWLINPAFYYKNAESFEENSNYLPLDDPASLITVRINLKHPRSPFRNFMPQTN